MATVSHDDLDAMIAELHTRRTALDRELAAIDRDIAAVEAAKQLWEQVAAIAARYGIDAGPVTAASLDTPPPASSEVAQLPSPRRGSPIPRIPPGTPRLSPARITELASAVREMSQRDAVLFVGQQEGEIQAADAQKVLNAAGKGSPRSSYAHKLLTNSKRFVRIGAGRFRLRDDDAPVPATPPHDAAQERAEGTRPATR